MIEKLSNFWKEEFKDFAPVAHELKNQYSNRWFRYHALPESKRYPETEGEYLEITRRHNVFLQDTFGHNIKLLVLLPEYSDLELPQKPTGGNLGTFSDSEPWESVALHEESDEFKSYMHLHVSEIVFTGVEFNKIFRLVADDKLSNILVVNVKRGVVFHPYDGGADVILRTTIERDRIKKKYRDWLSDHPKGL